MPTAPHFLRYQLGSEESLTGGRVEITCLLVAQHAKAHVSRLYNAVKVVHRFFIDNSRQKAMSASPLRHLFQAELRSSVTCTRVS